MDMTRKFLQMGMTRAKRYANHKGGKKYERRNGEDERESEHKRVIQVADGEDWEGRKEKAEASRIFREVCERAKGWEGYLTKKEEFLRKQKEWDRTQKRKQTVDGSEGQAKTKRRRVRA